MRHKSGMPASAVNLLQEERVLDAANLEEFARLLPLQPIGYDNGMVSHGEDEFCYAEKPASSPCEKRVFEAGSPRRLLPQIDPEIGQILNHGLTLDDLIRIARIADRQAVTRPPAPRCCFQRSIQLDKSRRHAANLQS